MTRETSNALRLFLCYCLDQSCGVQSYTRGFVSFQMEGGTYFLMIGLPHVGSENLVGKFICNVIVITD